jgi:hypothetical protein
MTPIEEMRLEVFGNKTDTTKDDLLNLKLKEAKDLFILIKYPFVNPKPTEVSTEYLSWVTMCAKELYNKYGNEGMSSYSENGLSISYDQAMSIISPTLRGMIVSKAGVPK